MEIKTGLVFKLGLGLWKGMAFFSQEHFVKTHHCVIMGGGLQVTSNYAEKYLLPFEDKCDYVLEICETTDDGIKDIYLNCQPTE